MSRDFIITADAAKVRASEFLAAVGPLFGKPNAEKKAERHAAMQDYLAAVQASYKLPTLAEGYDRREELKVQYEARLREIDQRYAEQLTETHGDPMKDAA